MSALYSDPPFPRGSTFLSGAAIETDDLGPVAGRDIVGQVKVFQDVNPTTGEEYSNRLVTCVAVRVATATALVAKDVVKFNASNLLAEVDGKGDNTSGQILAVVDEYIPSTLTIRQNDIIWVVVKGPTTAKFTSTAVATGVAVAGSATAGSLAAGSGFGHTLAANGAALESRIVIGGQNIG